MTTSTALRPSGTTAGPAGLTGAEVVARRARHGRNELPVPRPPAPWQRIASVAHDPMSILLLVTALASIAVLGDLAEGGTILVILVLNGVMQTVQQGRADRAVRALRGLAAPSARVRRDGRESAVAAAELVPGDVVLLAAGARVPADLRLSEAAGLAVDEAMLTGESLPVGKRRDDAAYAGTLVVRGHGSGVVTATGAATAAGAIGAELAKQVRTPLEREMRVVAGRVALVALAVGALLVPLAAARSSGEEALVDAVLAGVALAVAAIPTALVAVVTTALAVGARRMAAGGAIVRRLTALEALGAASVLCVDKTGTLTTGRLSLVESVAVPGREEALRVAALRCSNPEGDPVDEAIRAGYGEPPPGRRVAEHPFDPERRYMATWDEDGGGVAVSVKGAPEVVLARCAPGPACDAVEAAVTRAAGAGRRVLAVADGPPESFDHGTLRPLGVVTFADPLRPSTRAAVAACRRAGMRVVLVTGDHAATAAAVARGAGLDTGVVVTGGARDDALREADVVARVDPMVKLDLVRAHRAAGAVVAMTGDGVNDAPALRQADVGVAVADASGTDVAREAAGLVVTDGDLGTIVRAVAEGRRIWRNLATVVAYLVTGNLSEVLVVAGGLLLLPELAVPLLPVQLLWVNLVTDALPALAFADDTPPGDPLAAPPRGRDETLLGRRVLAVVAGRAGTLALLVLGAGLLARRWGWSPEAVRTQLLATLVPCHLMLAYVTRGQARAFEPGWCRNRLLLAAVGGSVALQVSMLVVAPLRHAFRLAPLPASGWLLAAAAAALLVAATDAARRLLPGGRS